MHALLEICPKDLIGGGSKDRLLLPQRNVSQYRPAGFLLLALVLVLPKRFKASFFMHAGICILVCVGPIQPTCREK